MLGEDGTTLEVFDMEGDEEGDEDEDEEGGEGGGDEE